MRFVLFLFRWQNSSNASKCTNCYCYVCDVVASSCTNWEDSHCNAFPSANWDDARRVRQLSQKNAVVAICLEKSTIKLKKMQACQEALQTFSTKLSVQESNFSSFTAALDANMNRSSSKLQEFNVIDAVQSKRSVDNQKFVNKGKRGDTYCCVQLW